MELGRTWRTVVGGWGGSRVIPSASVPGQAQQTMPHGSRSFVRGALHLDPWGMARSPPGWDEGRGDDPAGGAVARVADDRRRVISGPLATVITHADRSTRHGHCPGPSKPRADGLDAGTGT